MQEPASVFERVSDGVVALDRQWRYAYINKQAADLFGRRPEDLIGRHIWTEFPEGVGQPFHLAYERALAEQVFISMESYYRPWDRWFENRIYPSPDGVSIFFHEITERKRAEQAARDNAELLHGQNEVLALIARGAPVSETFDTLVRFAERQVEGLLASILLLDEDSGCLRHDAAPSLPVSFTSALDAVAIGPRAGSSGTAAFLREPVFVDDIAGDPLWADSRDLALAHGVRAAWSAPMLDASGRVLGAFAMYFRTPAARTERLERLMEMVTHTAAVALIRHHETDALRGSEERLRLAVTRGNVGIWEWDLATDRLIWSDQLRAMFGWRPANERLSFSMFMEAVHPADRDHLVASLERSLSVRASYDEEFRVVRPDATVQWVAAKGDVECDSAGRPVRMLGVALEITDRRLAMDLLQRSEERFQMVARATNDVIWDWDLATGALWWNQAITSVFGYGPDEIGTSIDWRHERIHALDVDGVLSGVRRAIDQGAQFWSGEYRFRRADGSYADILDRAIVSRDAESRAVRIIGAMSDVSERTRTLEVLEQRVALRTRELVAKNSELEGEIGRRHDVEQLLRAKNEELKGFAYTVSHDLKAPLRGILGYAQELDRRHREGLSDRALHCLKQIGTAARNLDRLIEDLLQYARLEAETAAETSVDLSRLVDGVLRDCKPAILQRRAEITVRLCATRIHTWERGVAQVLANLVDNALKYSRDADPPSITIASEERDGEVVITVTDNGIGFDMKYHDRMFGLFNRLVRQEDYEGTGVGLALVRKVADKLGGRAWAESEPGGGASFHVALPVRAAVTGEAP